MKPFRPGHESRSPCADPSCSVSGCGSDTCAASGGSTPPSTAAQPLPDRREFLCAVIGCAAAAASGGCSDLTHTSWFRGRFREMSDAEKKDVIADLEKQHSERFAKAVTVGAEPPLEGVEFGYALDISRCIGCRRCVYACVEENNQSRDPQVHWIRVLELDKDKGIDLAHANPYYDAEKVPRDGHFYLPVACQQCQNPPCVKSCPVGATWTEADGIVVIDYDWCIGCRCCMSACPYGARHINLMEPHIPAEELNPKTHYLGNRPRMKGVVEKCTFCIQRVRNGRYPACVEVCPVGARKFGNLLDPSSEVRYVIEHKRVFVLRSELNTRPRFIYFYGL
ncbi:MAG: 4Fe-4S dicluster domain-containing protein [Planctomycetes bacterium]|nr:4Fe-4S dicluster domain-containing protein [Planctomycetota bacterium]